MANQRDVERAREGRKFWNAWAEGNAGAEVDFSGTTQVRNFAGFVFPGRALFDSFSSTEVVSFNGARFSGEASFRRASFQGADFADAIFEARADFQNAKFHRSIVFLHATFFDRADFARAILQRGNSSFSLDHAEFHGDANFEGFRFLSGVSIKDAKFYGLATFNNVEIQARAVFADCTFSSVPTFHGAQLHQDTSFEGVIWPKRIQKTQSPYDAVRAWGRLRIEMSRLHKHEDELFFFAKELSARARDRRNVPPGKRLLYRIYLALGAGRSAAAPIGWLVGLNTLLYLPTYWYATAALRGLKVSIGEMLSDAAVLKIPADVVSFWLGQALPFIGSSNPERADLYRRLFAHAGSAGIDMPLWLELVVISQQLVGVVLLFMIGLSLRNRFRMK